MDLKKFKNKLYNCSSGESEPLLQKENEETGPSLFKTEFYWLIKKSLPIVSTHLLHSTLQLITAYTCGHLGAADLSAIALADMVVNLTCWSISYGIVSTIETLSSQSWTGSKDKTVLGIQLQRSIVILNILLAFCSILWWNSEVLFVFLNQDPEVSARACLYLRYLLIGAPAYVYFDATKKYMQAQGIMHASTLAIGVSIPLYTVINYVLVFKEPFQLGFIGVPISISLTYWLMLSIMVCYIRFVDGYSAWGGFSLECFKGLGSFIKLAIPSIISVTTDWWTISLSTLGVSYSGIDSLAAQYVLLTIESGLLSIPMGVGTAGSNRVGNNLGKGSARQAQYSYYATISLSFILGAVSYTLLTVFKVPISKFFTTNEGVAYLVEETMGNMGLTFMFTSIALGSRFTIIGLGRQIVTAISYIIVYYLFAIPIGVFICIKYQLGVHEFWCLYLGISCLDSFISNSYLSIIDWNCEVKRVTERVRTEELQIKNDTHYDI